MNKLNDNELIYLYNTNNCEDALEQLVKKYENLIWRIISNNFISTLYKEDFFQEGIICIVKCAKIYNPDFNKTFNKYFELVFTHEIWAKKKKLPKHILTNDFSSLKSEDSWFDEEEQPSEISFQGTKYENQIFDMYFKEKLSIYDISKKLQKEEKSIYNAIFRIRKKIINDLTQK